MKYLKLFESKSEAYQIDQICKKYNIKNYIINEDNTIDVNDDVFLYNRDIEFIPLNFRKVTGFFDCSNNNRLETLKGCPQHVGGYFDCSNNSLSNLEYCPQYVGGYFDCNANKLSNLKGCPQYVGSNFDTNNIESLEGCPENINGFFDCSSNKLSTLKNSPKIILGTMNCAYNKLTSLEGPKFVKSDFIFQKNKITNLLYFNNIEVRGSILLSYNPLPQEIKSNDKYIMDIVKWQNDYIIWNREGLLNKENFQELLNDINHD